jgi:glycine C-acetyltransferase
LTISTTARGHSFSPLRTRHPSWRRARRHFELLDSEAGAKLVKKLWANTKFFKRKLKKLGFKTGPSETPITPILVGDAAKAFEFGRELFAEGVFAPAIGYPTVPEGKARLRAIVTATHKRADLERALEILERVGKKLAIV